jgi:hypothetical protein
MKISRRELLQAGVGLGITAAYAAAADTRPLLGLIAPPLGYPVPPEALALYDKQIRFVTYGLGLKTMTPAGYDSVIDKIVPSSRRRRARARFQCSAPRSPSIAAPPSTRN